MNAEFVAAYLGDVETAPEATPFQRIRKVPAGHVLNSSSGGMDALLRWWHPRPVTVGYARALRNAVEASIEVPSETAIMLSGGLDSSAIHALAKARGREPLSVSMVFPDHPRCDESRLIALLKPALSSHGRVAISRPSKQQALEVLARFDDPTVWDAALVQRPALLEARRLGARVVVGGHLGDLVNGYCLPPGMDWIRAPFDVEFRLSSGRHYRQLVAGFLRRSIVGRQLRHGMLEYRYGQTAPLRPRWRSLVAGARRAGLDFSLDSIEATRRLLLSRTASDEVRLVRAFARAEGLEARFPYADPSLVCAGLGVPLGLRRMGRLTRAPLRRAVAGIVPDAVRLRSDFTSFDDIYEDVRRAVMQVVGDVSLEPLEEWLDPIELRGRQDGFRWRCWSVALWMGGGRACTV